MMCSPMTTPVVPSPCPWSRMWSGVPVIIATTERAGEGRDAPPLGERAHRRDEVRSGDRAESRGDQDRAHGGAAAVGRGEVTAGVPGLQVRRCAGAVDEQAQEQQARAAEDGGQHDAHAADRAGEVADRQAGTSAVPLGEGADEHGGAGGPEREQRRRHAGQRGGPEHVLREQGADGDAGTEPRPPSTC